MIGGVSTATPGYGATFTVTITFSGGNPVPITRVVFNRLGGVTHSTHFDQRQVRSLLPGFLAPCERY